MIDFPSGIPGLSPPPLLIFFHIPKSGGHTMHAVLRHCLQDKCLDVGFGAEPPDTCLWVYSTERIANKVYRLPVNRQNKVRCLIGEHFTYDVDTIFNRPSKFFTVLRHPVDRFTSHFFYHRNLPTWPLYRFVKDLTLEQYLDSGLGLDYDNQQVRMLSGCPELDAPWDPEGRPISTPPVERRHLEMAKRNIEERFIVAATLEQFTALVWFLKRLYGWPPHRALFRISNKNATRPRTQRLHGNVWKH